MDETNRGSWSARPAFIAAAVGSAVGLGNVWRFPNHSYSYGGGAFFLPYVLALVLVGMPILTLELSLGQVWRAGDAQAFATMNKRLRGIGLGSIWCSFMVVSYYVVIIAWALIYIFHCFGGKDDHFHWGTYEGGATSYFLKEIVGLGGLLNEKGELNRSMVTVPQTFFAVTFIWVCIFLCTFKGPTLTGRITYFTVTIPTLFLVFLSCYIGGLDGAGDGIDLYIGKWEMDKISGNKLECGGGSKPCYEAWPDATGQVFFSLSICFGVMTAYASYNKRNQNVQVDTILIALGDMLTSFIAGFMVFAAVGVLAKSTGGDVKTAAGGSGGLGLVFWTLPNAFEQMGGAPYDLGIGWRKFLAILFFSMVVLLGIDSAFSLCEAVSTCVKDSRLSRGISREKVIGLVCLVGYCVSFGYINDTGLYSFDAVDYYVNVSMIFVGYLECVSAGWIAEYEVQVERIGWPAWWTMLGSMIFPSIIAPRVGLGMGQFNLYDSSIDGGHWITGMLVGLLVGPLLFGLGTCIAYAEAKKHRTAKSLSTAPKEMLYDMLMLNVETLRKKISDVATGGMEPLWMIWSFLIKFFCPPTLMIMLLLKFSSPAYGNYEGYPGWYQAWGLVASYIPWVLFLAGLVCPQIYDFLLPEGADGATDSSKADATSDSDKVAPPVQLDL